MNVNLGAFVGSPFGLTANPVTAKHWAGRAKTLSRLNRLAHSIATAPESSLDIIWANFGAGKTHALLHLQHLLDESDAEVLFAYVEVPEQTRKFIELYRRVISAFDTSRLAKLVIAGEPNDPDLLRGCQAITYGTTSERELAATWLAGGNPNLTQLKSMAGISARIDDDVRATDKLIGIVNSLRSQGVRTAICFDEFQRLSLNNQRDGLRVMQSLRTVLSQCPDGLAFVLAIASRAEQTAMDQLPLELRTLVGLKPGIALPPLTVGEGLQFLKERMGSFRPEHFTGDEFAPFGIDGGRAIIDRVNEINDGRIGPRDILQAAGWAINQLGLDNVRDPEQLREVLEELTPER